MAIIVNPIEVRATSDKSIWILFADGVSGEIDLSHLRGKGVFKKWENTVPFSSVHINPENHVVAWDNELEIDADNLYLELIGKTFDEWQKEHEPIYAAN
jgi:hypothetical protein